MAATALMTIMMNAARKAGRRLARDFNEVEKLQVSIKSPANFVSQADLKAEETLHEELSKAREGYCFLMEERGLIEGPDKSHRWIIDPLDGTTNFLHGIPLFAISIALERNDELVASLVYNPVMDEMFTAEKGKGAFMNDQRMRVASRRNLEDSVIVTGIPHRGRGYHEPFLKTLPKVMEGSSGVRRTGSAALDLAWTAAGRFDGYWEHGLQPWDIAGGMLLIKEAGGFISDLKGEQTMLTSGDILVGNQYIHKQMLSLINS